MSGNRTLHREQVGLITASNEDEPSSSCTDESLPFWSVACTSALTSTGSWMVWTTGSQGGHEIRGYSVEETSLQEKQDKLEASALRLHWTHTCLDTDDKTKASLGASCVTAIRNYTGEDRNAGDWLLLSMDLSNVVRIWNLSGDTADADSTTKTTQEGKERHEISLTSSFTVENAIGTTAALLPPRLAILGDPNSLFEKVVVVAVGCLDGTVSLVSTGIPIFNPHHHQNNKPVDVSKLPAAGTILETWGSPYGGGGGGGREIPISLEWNPMVPQTLAVGSGDGLVHVFSKIITSDMSSTTIKHYRLTHLGSTPVRAVAFTADGNLILAGNDQGRLCVWDCSGKEKNEKKAMAAPALVHHVPQAHGSNTWILQLVPIDARYFCTLAANKTICVWNVGQLHQAMHTFQSNQSLFSLSGFVDTSNTTTTMTKQAPRLVAGSDNGWLELFSLEAN